MGASLHLDNVTQLHSNRPESGPTCRHIACEIRGCLPLLRALAKVRSVTEADANSLVQATLQRALADYPKGVPSGDLRPWLLGLQRSVYASRPVDVGVVASAAFERPARGANAMWGMLHRALLRLPDRQREAVMLADGAHCKPDELAALLGCSPEEAARLVTNARAALLSRLRATQHFRFPPEGVTSPRRQGRGDGYPRQRPGHTEGFPKPSQPAEARVGRQAFAKRLNAMLLRALVPKAADPAERSGLEALIDRLTAADSRARAGAALRSGSSRASRTSWLRLMFVVSAAPSALQVLRESQPVQ